MIGQIVSSFRREMDIRFDELSTTINRALKSSNPSLAAESRLDSICGKDLNSADCSIRHRPPLDMLSSERDGQFFFVLGRSHYHREVEGRKDFPRAARYFHAAYAEGYNSAAFYLGNLYYYGNGVDLNYGKAFEYYSAGAESGDAAAMSCLGWMYAFGCGVEVNGRLAVKWYNEGAKKGDGLGLWEAGFYALHGHATRQNFAKAVRYLKAAVRVGEWRAGTQLGICYLKGIGVERDQRKAIELLRKSYEYTGGENSTFWLASYYEGTGEDQGEAARLYKELADCQTPLGKNYSCYYGRCLVRGFGATQQDIDAGLKFVRKSLTPGWSDGWYVLGDIYRHGYGGVNRDVPKAVRYFSKAIICSGGSHGMCNSNKALAELYETGDGVKQNLRKAAHHYVRAANNLDRTAQWKAGLFFEAGIGVDEDVQRAFVFFDMCARSGHVQGQRKAGELYMRGKGVERDRSKALRLLQEASDRGDARALAELRRARRPHLLCWRRIKTE